MTATRPELGRALLRRARYAIASELGVAAAPGGEHPSFAEPGATFVTLLQHGELRGCIGSLEPRRRLGVDVHENAIAAAFRDPRFAPLARSEFVITAVEVSLIGPVEALAVGSEAELLLQLRPGEDGLILGHGARRATFLPQVWEALPDPRDFVAALKRKAGWPAGFWADTMNVERYSVLKWKESDFALEAEFR